MYVRRSFVPKSGANYKMAKRKIVDTIELFRGIASFCLSYYITRSYFAELSSSSSSSSSSGCEEANNHLNFTLQSTRNILLIHQQVDLKKYVSLLLFYYSFFLFWLI